MSSKDWQQHGSFRLDFITIEWQLFNKTSLVPEILWLSPWPILTA